jgi:hypothetical protein
MTFSPNFFSSADTHLCRGSSAAWIASELEKREARRPAAPVQQRRVPAAVSFEDDDTAQDLGVVTATYVLLVR